MCSECRGLTDGCPNCDNDTDFDDLLDIELNHADDLNDEAKLNEL